MRLLGAVAACVLALAGSASSRSSASASASASVSASPESPPGLEHLGTEVVSARLQVARFRSPAVERVASVRVLLPEGYDPSGATRYPVLYLLHGATGSSITWLRDGAAEAITAGYPLIVVLPDGGEFGYYADWWNFGAGGAPQWETFHLEQLLPWVDATYPTVGTRDGRAVAGDSMGGLGAMHYAAKRPDLFTAAASFSGAIDTNFFVAPPVVELSAMLHGTHLPAAVFGPRLTEEVRWRGHNPVDLAENLRGLFLQFDVGNGLPGGPGGDGGDPIEMGMQIMATSMRERLTRFGIDHRWNAYGPGCHCWYYYQRDLRELLPPLMERFAHPVPPPSPFGYTSVDPSYAVYGWDVSIDRPAMEFSRLFDAGPAGFRLQGSGAASVTTAASTFGPGQRVGVTVADAGGTARSELVADGAGRLTVPVSLGPGNPHQQHSLAGLAWLLVRGGLGGPWPSVTASVAFEPVSGADAAGDLAGVAPPSVADAAAPSVPGPAAVAGAASISSLPTTGPVGGVPPLAVVAAGAVLALLARTLDRRTRSSFRTLAAGTVRNPSGRDVGDAGAQTDRGIES